MVIEQSVYMFALRRVENGSERHKTLGYYEQCCFAAMRRYACRLAKELSVELCIVKIRMNVSSVQEDLEQLCGIVNKQGEYIV